jgi:predicted peptidase
MTTKLLSQGVEMNLAAFRPIVFGLSVMLVLIEAFVYSKCPLNAQADESGRQTAALFETKDGTKVDYLIYLPPEYQQGGEKKFPLMLFLHGRGESQGGIQSVAKWGPPQMVARGEDLPFIIVSPQCPPGDFWTSDRQLKVVNELLDGIMSTHAVDLQRVYLTGLSMGGFGSWSLAAQSPEKFAAAVPICGAGDPKRADRLKDLPIWVFHGEQDNVIPIKRSTEMVEAIRAAGGSLVRYTTLEHVGHNSWSAAYSTPEIYNWMLQQTKGKPTNTEKSPGSK